MTATQSNPATPKPTRRRFQFSLRTLLLVVSVLGVLLGWSGIKLKQAWHQKTTVVEIQKTGGVVFYDYQFDERGRQRPAQEPPGPEWLRSLLGVDLFVRVSYVALPQGEVDDGMLTRLEALDGLKYLWLYGTDLGDDAMMHIAAMEDLEELHAAATRVSDSGVAQLKGLAKLRLLDLSWTEVSDAALVHLKSLSDLDTLVLRETHVTAEGVGKLIESLAGVEILWSHTPSAEHQQAAGAIIRLGGPISDFSPPSQPEAHGYRLIFASPDWKGSTTDLTRLRSIVGLKSLVFSEMKLNGKDIAVLQTLPELRQLILCGAQLTNADLAVATGFGRLESLALDGTSVGDAGLASLATMRELRSLNLSSTSVSDAGLVHLRGFAKLERICLGGTQVTDAGLANLEGLTQLKELELNATSVTDAGLVHLERLENLELLFLDENHVTHEALSRLQAILPALKIMLHLKQGSGSVEFGSEEYRNRH